jgi:2-iminobutanoate/2-iminopropanoate deaminase
MNKIETTLAPIPAGSYSQAIEAGGVVYCSGQLGLDPTTSALVDGGIEAQTERALRNLQAILEASGATLRSVVKTTVMVRATDASDFGSVNRVYHKIFTEAKGEDSPLPARTTFGVAQLPLNALVEIDCVALHVLRSRPKGTVKHEKLESAG